MLIKKKKFPVSSKVWSEKGCQCEGLISNPRVFSKMKVISDIYILLLCRNSQLLDWTCYIYQDLYGHCVHLQWVHEEMLKISKTLKMMFIHLSLYPAGNFSVQCRPRIITLCQLLYLEFRGCVTL